MLRADKTAPRGGRAAAEARRDEYIQRVRLLHVLMAFNTVHFGEVCSRLRGTAERGLVSSSDNADHHVVAWSPEGVIAIAYDDDEPPLFHDRDCTDIAAVLADVPASLSPLVSELAKAWTPDMNVTAARWIEVTDDGPRVSVRAKESEQLARYETPGDVWAKTRSRTDAHALLGLELTRTWTQERRVVTSEESRMLLESPEYKQGVPANPANVKRAVTLLGQVGIDWPTGVADAERLAVDDPDHGYALIDAVAAGDAAAVEALLEKGANLEKRSREGQVATNPMGRETPLAVAARQKDLVLAKRLLAAGASADGVLQAAAFGGSRAMCELLIEHGASTQGLFEAGMRRGNGSAEVVELALDLGLGKPLVPGWYRWLRETCVRAGRKDVLERCPGYEEMERRYQEMHAAELLEQRSQAGEIVFYVWMRHILTAIRSLHFDVAETSRIEGSARAGRFAFATKAGEHHVVGWNEHGVVLWGAMPGVDRRVVPIFTPKEAFTASSPASLPPGARFQHRTRTAPPPLLELVEEISKWEPAPAELTDWKWVFPAGSDRFEISGGGFSGGKASLFRYGKYYDGDTYPGTENWPREAYALERALADRVEQIAKASMQGPYEITADDEELFRAKQPKSRKLRADAIPRAVEMLGALGIRWTPRG